MSGPLNGDPKSGDPDPAVDPPRPPRQSSPADLPPIRRLLTFLYIFAGGCGLLALFLWWQVLR